MLGGRLMLPKINQICYIELASNENRASGEILRSRVADVDDEHLYIEIPLDENSRRLYKSQIGERFVIFYMTQDGMKNFFETTVTGFRKEVVGLVALRKPDPEQIAKEQRRNYLRVEANLELAVNVPGKMKFLTLTEDIGGGGISFLCDKKRSIDVGEKLDCWLLINYRNGSLAHAHFEAEVVRMVSISDKKNLLMLRINQIAEVEQQKIIRYCFERQLDMRRD